MIPIMHFRAQQERLLGLVARIRHEVGAREVADATLVILDVARLTGLVAVHVAQVDRALWPPDRAQGRGEVQSALRQFRDSVAGLADMVRLFNRRWLGSEAIAADPIGFRVDVHYLLAMIEERIAGEETLFVHFESERPASPTLSLAPLRPPVASPAV